MRRALALAAAVVSARQDHLCAEDVCFYHVPKTGGDSFKYLLRDELKSQKRTFWSNEWCPRRSNGTAAMLFREPRAHVVSQYFECRDSEWALKAKRTIEGIVGAGRGRDVVCGGARAGARPRSPLSGVVPLPRTILASPPRRASKDHS